MEYQLVQQQYLVSPGENITTFYKDESLPSLPVPPLELTIERYLKSAKPFADSEEEFLNTKKIAEEFLRGEGAKLHSKLLLRAQQNRNWLEKWWEDYAYLSLREPLIPHYNMSGTHPLIPGYHYGPGQQLKIASAYCHQLVMVWQILRQERLRPATAGDGRPLTMHQFRRIFNCSVKPGIDKDTIITHFKTEKEGECSSNIVVLCNGHMFVVDGLRTDKQPLTPAEWEHQLTMVKGKAVQSGAGVPRLSCDFRTPWAQNREHLLTLNTVNGAMLAIIEEAMFVVCLDNASPSSEADISSGILCGDYACRWPDAALNVVFFNNGYSGVLCAHSAYDGIVNGVVTLLAASAVQATMGRWIAPVNGGNLSEPQHLNFVLDHRLRSEIDNLKLDQVKQANNHSLVQYRFEEFGKNKLKSLKVHPDSFIQMALQLAYFKIHSRCAPCYETATTRAFYHGRTETVRSCTEECVAWVKSMHNKQIKDLDAECGRLLLQAIKRHNELMVEGRNNQGCDRHLLGLYCTALENQQPVPDLFLDPLFAKSGGGGNFVLSTSLLGYAPLSGCVVPMCLDGYGIFYSIMPDSLMFTVSVRKDSFETSTNKMYESICDSMRVMADLLQSQTKASSKL